MKNFNPKSWQSEQPNNKPKDSREIVEEIIASIKNLRIDLTYSYENWLNIGFALASEFGEGGRAYFHAISSYYPHYDYTVCDKQYSSCSSGKRAGISIKTLYYLAKAAGINIVYFKENYQPLDTANVEPIVSRRNSIKTPKIPNAIFDNLPPYLKEITDQFNDALERDVILISSLGVLSACLPNIEGNYMGQNYSPHLYLFISAPAASGKGTMRWTRLLGEKIHNEFIEKYNNEKATTDKPEKLSRKLFYIPANSSSTAFIQALRNSDFNGVLFETEADTLVSAFKQEWGNFSDVLRKAFHHENTSYIRRKDNEYEEINNPHLAIILSGTPKQVISLMPDVENGLFSRFCFYTFFNELDFKNPFEYDEKSDLQELFKMKGDEVQMIYSQLQALPSAIKFKYTKEQGERFTAFFNEMLKKNQLLLGADFDANIKRLGVISFRISMILCSLRNINNLSQVDTLVCEDIDFQNALELSLVLEKHATSVYHTLPNNELKTKQLQFYEQLPSEFNRSTYLKTAHELNIKEKSAENYIMKFKQLNMILHNGQNHYQKAKLER